MTSIDAGARRCGRDAARRAPVWRRPGEATDSSSARPAREPDGDAAHVPQRTTTSVGKAAGRLLGDAAGYGKSSQAEHRPDLEGGAPLHATAARPGPARPGCGEDINASGRYDAIRPRVRPWTGRPSCGAGRAIWVVGAQKVVPDLATALRRIEEHALPLESARTQAAYGSPSAINRLLILDAEPYPGRGTVPLVREAIGF